MSNEYYTFAATRFGKILYRGYELKDGKKRRVHGRLAHKPTMYLESTEDTEFKSIYGKPLREKKFETIPEAREFVKQYSDVMPIYGYAPNRFEYEFLARAFPDTLNVGIDDIEVATLDIETEVPEEGGFPDPTAADNRINLITFHKRSTREKFTFGFTPTKTPNFILCTDEADLLQKSIDWVVQNDPDILTGWNVNPFDIPYFINRSNKILGEDATAKLSPFGLIESKDEVLNGRETQIYTIVGRVILDMLELYKKFVMTKRESYKLDHIAKVELGAGKLELPYKSFRENYMKAWDLFVEYNQIDVDRVVEMEDKLGLLSLSLAMSYLTKINYSDVYSPVKCWECYILSTLMNEKTFVAVKREHHSGDGIEGAFIAEPDPGFYGWVLSIDATALYPSFIIGLNMSPETLMGMDPDCSVQNFLSGLSKSDTEYAYAANGAYFRKDVQGVLPRLAQKVLDGRAIAKKEMLRLKQLHIDTGDEKYKKLSALQNTFQGAFKVLNNALFGSLANAGFIFFDTRIAEGITMTGQFGIQHVGNHCNKRFNDFFKTKDQKYNIYSDTDSIFFTFQNIVDKYYSDKTDLQITDALDKLMEQHLRKLVDEATDEIAIRQNFYKKTLFFKRENICSGGFWLAKKKYALKVYDSEGVRYPEGDYKIMGIEVVRSSTPEMAREALKECVALIIDKNLDALRLKVDEVHKQFLSFSPELIAFPRSANNLLEYSDDTRIYKKGTPIAVRGTLLHNHYLKHLKITNLYQEIREGDKIKFIYLKEPNYIKENIIAFIDKLPDEFRLDKYIDRETQFEKVFMAPLIHILDAVKWKLVEEQSLDDFFG